MKSSSGEHYIALDHIRACAALLVIVWHFTHGRTGYPVPFEGTPWFPFAVLDEGHTGVALFMTLSGYLFAKLINHRSINYNAFLWNRALRLLPLLALVLMAVGIQQFIKSGDLMDYAKSILWGAIYPTLPNGGWSITVEIHYYLILPLVLWLGGFKKWLPLALIGMALLVRCVIYQTTGEVLYAAYGTLIGRIDQFILGAVCFSYRHFFKNKHLFACCVGLVFSGFYGFFDQWGGFYRIPSQSPLTAVWIVLPTLEAITYAALIAWYDTSFQPQNTGFSKIWATLGAYSYSIYLLHFFVVFEAADFVHTHLMNIANFYVAAVWAVVFFGLMYPIGYLSYRFIEAPFLQRRRPYIKA